MSEGNELIILPDPAALAAEGARRFAALAREAITARGRFSVALAGGNTPRAMYEQLAQPPFKDAIDWANTHIFWSDERYVPPDDPESNFRMARDALLAHVPIPAAHIYPAPTVGATPEAAAEAYSQTLIALFGVELPRFDLILLGLGPDGHTASLFPGAPELTSPPSGLVIAVHDAPKPPPTRISFTLKLINAAAVVIVLVSGAEKAMVLREVLRGPLDPARLPAQGVRPAQGALVWLVDQAAAKQL
jgi:6-phosphogluconolactonase